MSLVLFLVGMVSLLLFVARDLGVQVRENINLSVVLEDEITDTYRQRIPIVSAFRNILKRLLLPNR